MFDDSRSFITRAFLRAAFDLDYRAFTKEQDAELLKRLHDWDGRLQLSETQAEGAFTQTFFVNTWGYGEAGRVHTAIAKFPVAGEGAGGGAGEADLALGWFRGRKDAIPQVLCEFKDIRSRLDAKQSRKGSTRSPVEQCLNYVRGARRGLFGNEPVQPWWGLVTDMNEFRLYWWDRAPAEYIRFFIRREDLLSGGYDLLGESEDARFDRYLFAKLFSRDMLLSEAGRPQLLRLVERQWAKGRKLEGEFYDRYKEVRERLYNVHRTIRISRQTRRAAAADPEAARPLHLRLLLRGHGRADVVSASDAPRFLRTAASSRSTTRMAGTVGVLQAPVCADEQRRQLNA